MTQSATDFGLCYRLEGTCACRGDLDAFSKPEKASRHAGLENHVGASIGVHDAWNPTVGAKVWRIDSTTRRAIYQAAFLPRPSSMEVLVVEEAFSASRSTHL
jgi:hypothetical protein